MRLVKLFDEPYHISSDLRFYRKKFEYSEWIRKKPNQSLITFFLAYNWFSNDSTQIKYEGYDLIYMSYHTFVPSYYRIYQREYLRGVYRTHQLELVQLPYARHYNPRFVFFLPTFWSPKTFFQGSFFLKFWPYVWLVFKSSF